MRAKEVDAAFCQSDYILRDRGNKIYRGTILEHLLIENLVQFFNVGEHNIIRLENADWNDGLDMASEKGESVTFSFMYAHNLRDICFILEELKKKQDSVTLLRELAILLDRINEPVNYSSFKEKQKRLKIYLEKAKNISGKKMKVKIDELIDDLNQKAGHLSAWLRDKEWLSGPGFFNGYYDNKGRRVEGKLKGKIRMMLPPQVFAIMSGVATKEQVKAVWVSLKRYLKDKELEGFRLNTDFGSVHMDLGRAFGFSYGDKENGAFFNHMVVMLANALYKRGFIEEGYEALNSIYKMAHDERSQILPMIPEYFNTEGRGLYYYLTGSASWYIHTLMEEVLGVKFSLGDICLEPKLTSRDFVKGDIEVKFRAGGKTVKVVYFKNGAGRKTYKPREVFLEKRRVEPSGGKFIIKKEFIKKINRKEIVIKVRLA
jgi:cellobiose phosphorylase